MRHDNLKANIRFLGRILGDTIKEQEGSDLYNIIEETRKNAILFEKNGSTQAKKRLSKVLDDLSVASTIDVIRAFSLFSLLSNIAEDQNQKYKNIEASYNKEKGSIEYTFELLKKHKIPITKVEKFISECLINPVLTAHPTEVQRKSILDLQRKIARLLGLKTQSSNVKNAPNWEEEIRQSVETLWQTRTLRELKLSVEDEIRNALSYYRYTFLSETPRIYKKIETMMTQIGAKRKKIGVFLQIGSWIGGDRDGNPYVTDTTLRYAVKENSKYIFEFYLREVNLLRSELSISSHLVDVTPELLSLATTSPDQSAHRTDELY